MNSSRISSKRIAFLGLIALVAVRTSIAWGAEAVEPKRVLIVHSFARDAAPFGSVASTLRSEVTKRLGGPVTFDEIDLEAGRLSEDGGAAVVAFLNARFAMEPPDVIVALGPPAAQFCTTRRDELFPAVPRVMIGGERLMRTVSVAPNDALVMPKVSLHDTIEGILRVRPDTTHIALVLGSGVPDRFWASQLRRELLDYVGRLQVISLDDRPFDQVLEAVAALPDHTAIVYYTMSVDSRGVVFEGENALAALHAITPVPIFGVLEDQVGKGIVGGVLLSESRGAVMTADVVLQVLSGDASYARVAVMPPTLPTYDWRELNRWAIPESALPPDSVVRFRPSSLWEAHRTTILVGISVIAVQAVLIVLLLIQRLRRKHAEAEVLKMSARLISAHEDERRRLAGELHDDFSQRLARLAIDASQLDSTGVANGAATAQSMRDELIRLSEDVHDLSYRLHPSIVDDLGLIAALRAECSRTARDAGLEVDVRVGDVPARIAPDVALCVFRVAQEALQNVVRHAGASTVDVSLDCVDDTLRFVARDDGGGFAGERRGGLGLTSMRERVRQLGGWLSVDSAPGNGTQVTARVPLVAAAQ